MAANRLVSRGTAYFAVISTLNLLVIMAAIANDDSAGNSSIVSTTSTSSPRTTVMSSTPRFPPVPSISSLVRSPGYDTVIKVIGNSKDRVPNPTSGTTFGGKVGVENSTLIPSLEVMNSSSTSPFTTQNWTEIRAQYKSNAMLPCHVRNSGEGVTVSWIRRHDYHLLTVGLQTYSSDDRFQSIHAQSPDDWTLKIKYVQKRDQGIYECQVSTHPPSSIFVTLSVVEVRAEIVGGPEKIYKAGSTVELKCDLTDSTEEPEYVFWYQGLQMINYDRSRHINVTHYKSSSVLVLHNVQKSDTGNYSCVPSNAIPSSIFVHIINGENPAAMQHGSHSTSCVPCPPLWFLSFVLSLTLQALYFQFLSNHVDRYHERAMTLKSKSTLQHFHHNHHIQPTSKSSNKSTRCNHQQQKHQGEAHHPLYSIQNSLSTTSGECDQKSGTKSLCPSQFPYTLSNSRRRATTLPAVTFHHSSRSTSSVR